MEVELGEFHPKSPRNDTTYSDAPKSGRPVFGAFDLCPVCESSGFQTTSDNRTILSGYRTSGCFQFQPPVIGHPVPIENECRNRFQTGFGTGSPALACRNRFGTGSKPVSALERLKSGQYCPVIGCQVDNNLSGYRTFVLYYMSEIRTD